MKIFALILLFCLSGVLAEHEFHLINHCRYPVYPGIASNLGSVLPMKGGFKLGPGEMEILHLPDGWSGRIWGRTQCDYDGKCQTGDCGGKVECAGAGPTGPTTVAHINLDGHLGQDHYEISLVDGANIPMQIWPPLKRRGPDPYQCHIATFTSLIHPNCPIELSVFNRTGHVIACKSPCQAFGTDQHCCTGNAYSQRATCREGWTNSPRYLNTFKIMCRECRNVPFDNTRDTFFCARSVHSNSNLYDLSFCFPGGEGLD